jgi:hypothetical protein
MKHTVLLTLSLLAFSFPVMAKPHHLHHHHYTARTSHHAEHYSSQQHVDHYTSGVSHSGITCEMVRAYVAKVGLGQAIALAKSAGISAAEEERARQCLAKRI